MLLSSDRLPRELKRVENGVLVRLPVPEFDALVQRARRGGASKVRPRLVEARYHAVLEDEALIGDGQWKVRHRGKTPSLLKLQPFNLALRQARFENDDALIAAFDGKTPALLVETAGLCTVSLDWSARGEAGPEGLQFHLEVPPCPVAILELDVAAGRRVDLLGASDDSLLLSGPHAAETEKLRRWRIVWRQREKIDFRIRAADRSAPGVDPSPFVTQKTTQKLHPEGLDAVFELTVDGLSRGVRQLVCECDPELRLRDVIGPQVDGCSFQTGKGKKPSRLTIRLRKPLRGGTWQILCLAPLSATPTTPAGASRSVSWRSPGIRLVGGVPRGETMTLWLHPDLRVESWNAGDFRLRSLGKADGERSTGMQQLTMEGGGLAAEGGAASPRRPQARLQAYGVEFRTRQLDWWRCQADGMSLTSRIIWQVSQGQLFQLPVRLPNGWTVERVEMNPADLLRDWHVRGGGGRSTLYVDLNAPLAPRTNNARPPSLTVHLRPTRSGSIAGRTMEFPDLLPIGARFREGALALDGDEQLFRLEVDTKAQRSEPEGEGLWGKRLPEYYYRYHGQFSKEQPLKGKLKVQARPPLLRAWCGSDVFVASGRAAVTTHLRLQAEVGSPQSIDLSLSASDGEAWQWRREADSRAKDAGGGNGVRRAERLYSAETSATVGVLAAANPLQAAVLLASQPPGEHWRLTFVRPLRARETLRLQASRPLQPHGNVWKVPLPVVLGPGRMEGEVTLHLSGGDLVQVRTAGLNEAVSAPVKGATPWRTFRYGQTKVALTLSGRAAAVGRSAVAVVEAARLLTYVSGDGLLQHHFSFRIANWGQRTLPLRLPADSRPLAVAVDGHWLPRLLSSASAAAQRGEARELALPVPARGDALPAESSHRYEIVYVRSAPSWTPWQTLHAPAPVLPVAPLAFRRIWRLTPTLAPLFDGSYQLVPGTHGASAPSALPRRAGDLFRWPTFGSAIKTFINDDEKNVRAALARAVEDLCVNWAKQETALGEAIGELAFVYLKDRYALVVDAAALRDAGITPETPLKMAPLSSSAVTPPWNELGLIAVPGRSAILLTTTGGRGSALREPLSESVDKALAAAAAEGQDPSGRFRSALSWLRPRSTAAATPLFLPRLDAERFDWSEWEPVDGLSDDAKMIVVRRDVTTGSGLALVIVLALLFWMFRRRSLRLRRSALLACLAAFGLGLLWLPSSLRDVAWFPLLTLGAGGLAWYGGAVLRGGGPANSALSRSKKTASAVGVVLVVILAWGGRAAPPTPILVYLVPSEGEKADKQTVLVPADFLDHLKALSRPARLAADGPRAVLLEASYDGKMVDDQAEFAAVFFVHNLDDGATSLAVPLDGVRLVGDVWLDGARVDPRARPAPQIGYSVKVSGRGRHKVELRFRVPVAGTPEDRNVLFTAPPVLQSRLTWHAPAAASDTCVLVKQGAERRMREDGVERLEADLGRLPKAELGDLPRPVHLHWYQPAQAGRAARVHYRAAYLWDLNVQASSLTTWLHYEIAGGAVKTLDIDLPADLEVRSASAQRTRPKTAIPPAWLTYFRLRDWKVIVSGGKRVLRLQFPYAISGKFQVRLELAPRTPLSAAVTLSLPWPRGQRMKELHYLAYRTHPGLIVQRDTPQYITRIAESEFAPNWPGVPRLSSTATEVNPLDGAAYKISPGGRPVLRLHLHRSPPIVHSDLDVSVQADAGMAEVRVVADLKTPNKDVIALEWDLRSPRLTIASVTGKNVRAWKQSGDRLLVWLKRAASATNLHLSGWLPLQQHQKRGHLKFAGPQLLQTRGQQHTRLRVATAADLALASVQTNNLRPLPAAADRQTNERERIFETKEASYRVDCDVQPAANAVARVLTLAEVVDRRLRFTSTVDYEIRHGELRHVRVRLRNWEAEKVELQAESELLRRASGRTPAGRFWQLTLQLGVTGRYQLTLRGSMPVEEAAVGVPMPEISVLDVETSERKLAVAGGELVGEARGGLTLRSNPDKELALWPGAAERVERTHGRVWKVGGAEWRLRLLPRTRSAKTTPVRIFLLEQSALVVDGRQWMHEACYWLRHEAHTDLNVDLPAPARVVAAAVDGVVVTPLQPRSSRLWLPLPGRSGVRRVRLRWLYNDAEPLDHPNLTAPRLVDAIDGPILTTVLAPAGWDAARSDNVNWLGAGAGREGALALHRAEAQLRISQELCRQERGTAASASLSSAQRRFARYCLQARRALDVGGNRAGVKGPNDRTLADWLEKLQADNRLLVKQNRIVVDNDGEQVDRFGADNLVDCFAAAPANVCVSRPRGGTPISWQSSTDGEAPTLRLTEQRHRQIREKLVVSGQWLGAVVVVWILSFVPFLLPSLRRLWPEQIALLGVAGWRLAGATPMVLLLLLIAVGGRIFLIVGGLGSMFRKRSKRPSHPAEPRSSGSGGAAASS